MTALDPSATSFVPAAPEARPNQAIHSTPLQSAPSTNDSNPTANEIPPYPTTFAQIVDLITRNQPIPGIEQVPETVLEPGSSKQDKAEKRQKPWETVADKSQFLPVETTAPGVDEVDDDHTVVPQQNNQVRTANKTGEGVVNILKASAVPDSGLIAKE